MSTRGSRLELKDVCDVFFFGGGVCGRRLYGPPSNEHTTTSTLQVCVRGVGDWGGVTRVMVWWSPTAVWHRVASRVRVGVFGVKRGHPTAVRCPPRQTVTHSPDDGSAACQRVSGQPPRTVLGSTVAGAGAPGRTEPTLVTEYTKTLNRLYRVVDRRPRGAARPKTSTAHSTKRTRGGLVRAGPVGVTQPGDARETKDPWTGVGSA